MAGDFDAILDAAYPKVVATLVRVLGDVDRAMDASQDALVKALQVWRQEGVPDNPVAWLVTVGRNRAIDHLRRDSRVVSIEGQPLAEPVGESLQVDDLDAVDVGDDLLQLLFVCCHPSLTAPAQISLMLKVVLGLSVAEIARGLLASPASVEKRITRAKAQLRKDQIAYQLPAVEDIPVRLDMVLKAVYLLFNEGYSQLQESALGRGSMIDVALRLGRMICRLVRQDPRPRSLLALMLLNAARVPARVTRQGVYVPLVEQDRTLWHQGMIQEGLALIDAVFVARHRPDAYQIQAAISALHCQAASGAETDWQQIAQLYTKLKDYDPSPVVTVNEAVAICYCGDAHRALGLLKSLDESGQLQDYQPLYVARALAYEQMNDVLTAQQQLERAIGLVQSSAERVYLQRRLESLRAD